MVTTGQIAVGANVTPLLSRVRRRIGCIVTNVGAQTAYIGTDNNVTVNNGFALLAGSSITTTIPAEFYIVSNSTGTTVSYINDAE